MLESKDRKEVTYLGEMGMRNVGIDREILRNTYKYRVQLCPLCGGKCWSLPKIKYKNTCPHCGQSQTWTLNAHCPGGISHGESHRCKCCYKLIFFIVYHNRTVDIGETRKKIESNPSARCYK